MHLCIDKKNEDRGSEAQLALKAKPSERKVVGLGGWRGVGGAHFLPHG